MVGNKHKNGIICTFPNCNKSMRTQKFKMHFTRAHLKEGEVYSVVHRQQFEVAREDNARSTMKSELLSAVATVQEKIKMIPPLITVGDSLRVKSEISVAPAQEPIQTVQARRVLTQPTSLSPQTLTSAISTENGSTDTTAISKIVEVKAAQSSPPFEHTSGSKRTYAALEGYFGDAADPTSVLLMQLMTLIDQRFQELIGKMDEMIDVQKNLIDTLQISNLIGRLPSSTLSQDEKVAVKRRKKNLSPNGCDSNSENGNVSDCDNVDECFRTEILTMIVVLLMLLVTHATASRFESRMAIVDTKLSVKLDPSVQHIPLDPAEAHLRPPPALIPVSFDIFVGLSVFRDGFRCGKTIFTAIRRAKYPERLFFGVVDQINESDERCLDEYCKMSEAEWPDEGPCPYKDHIRVDIREANKSRGPTLARFYQQKLIRHEEFCLQLDGHSIFTNLWDENLLAEWKRVNNEMAVLSTYLHHLHNFVKENGDNALSASVPHLCSTTRGTHGLVRTVGASMIRGSKFPQLQALWGAGLSFSKCHAEHRVPVDSHTLWMFDGEEFLRASRLWTSGYDFYSPSELGSVIYHNYSRVPARFERITVDKQTKKREVEMAVNRFNHLLGKPVKGLIDTFELDKYGLGSVRSLKSYLTFSGVNFKKGSNDTGSCKQLHWVPYDNATEVEALMGNGWTLSRSATAAGRSTMARRGEDADNENGTDFGVDEQLERAKARLRQKIVNSRMARSPSTTPIWFIILVVMVALLVALSNDSMSRFIRLQIRASSLTHPSNTELH
ncbi:putative glycosyltransferase, GlcNAc [Plasmopara halstedii]